MNTTDSKPSKPAIPRTILILGVVSFFTDMSTEMIYPLLPVFLSTVLGAGPLVLGIIEGVAESTASFLKLVSGIWTDRTSRRKPLILAGYSLAGTARPLIGLALSWPMVLALRFIDRVGKGLRTSPRDALIADAVSSDCRGQAYGYHRAMDHAGAVVGPLTAAGILAVTSASMRFVFLLAAVPAAIVIILLIVGIKEKEQPLRCTSESFSLKSHWKDLPKSFKSFLAAILIFTAGNSTDAFMLLALSKAGWSTAMVAVLWSLHHVVKMASTYLGGRFSDAWGRKRLILSGWILYCVVYGLFALVKSPMGLVFVFLCYGIYFGLTEPCEKAWVADLVPAHLRGTAFGSYHLVVGIGALPASLIFGLIWKTFGAPAAFFMGAALAAMACLLLWTVPENRIRS